MKKTLLVLSAIATLFAFVSCGGGAEPDGPAKSDTPANNTPVEAVKLFDIAAWKAANGYSEAAAVVDGDYLKVTLAKSNEYNNMVYVPADITVEEGTKIKFKGYLDGDGAKYTINFMDKDWGSLGSYEGTNKEAADIEVTLKAGALHQIQIFSQDASGGLVDGTLYISSITN